MPTSATCSIMVTLLEPATNINGNVGEQSFVQGTFRNPSVVLYALRGENSTGETGQLSPPVVIINGQTGSQAAFNGMLSRPNTSIGAVRGEYTALHGQLQRPIANISGSTGSRAVTGSRPRLPRPTGAFSGKTGSSGSVHAHLAPFTTNLIGHGGVQAKLLGMLSRPLTGISGNSNDRVSISGSLSVPIVNFAVNVNLISFISGPIPNFYPVWITPVGDLGSVTENTTPTITLQAIREAVFMGITDQNVVDIGESPTHITNVKVNANTVSYIETGNTIILNNRVGQSDIIDITTNDPITFTLLHDNLPPGLTLSNTGVISGKVGLLPIDGSSTYSFAVRISDGYTNRDRQFTIEGIPSSALVAPPGWGSLPAQLVQSASPSAFRYVPLGSAIPGSPFQFQLGLYEPSGEPPTLTVEFFLDTTTIVSPFNSFPTGLTLDPHTGLISGTIDPNLPIGKYFFKIVMQDFEGNPITVGSGATPMIFMINVSPPQQTLTIPRYINWSTPAGLLATVYEGQVFPLGVRATCTTGDPVTYVLQSQNALPDGLTLNGNTGDIEGVLAHIPANRTFTFTIRAMFGQTFSDRTFSITVLARYTTSNFTDVNFCIRVVDSIPMATYYNSIINNDQYFRPTDLNFGRVGGNNTMSMLVIGGLGGPIGSFENIVRASNFDAPVNLLLGEHKIAYATVNGTIVYEVLYREVIDPMARAGGYVVINGVPTQDLVLYPESALSSPQYIYPNSINNIRDEFLTEVGFPTIDATISHNLTAGGENLPLWMTCPQSGTDQSTALGYIPVVPIAYLQPGQGKIVLNQILARSTPAERPTDITDPLRIGHQVSFDQYLVVFQTTASATTFNNGMTTFDGSTGPIINFDIFVYSGGKLLRMNRAQYNTTT